MGATSLVQTAATLKLAPVLASSVATALASRPESQLSLVPPECRYLKRYQSPPSSIPAGSPLVNAFPLVLASDAEVARVLAAILGANQQGGAALVNTIAKFTQSMGDVAQATPSFVAAGWMPDPENDQSKSRGTLWVANAWAHSVSSNTAALFNKDLMRSAVGSAGFAIGSTGSPRISGVDSAPVMAAGQADQDLQAAAIQSVQGLGAFATLFGFVVGTLRDVTGPSGRIVSNLKSAATTLNRALEILQQASTLTPSVDAAVAAALEAPPEAAAEQQQILTQLDQQLGQIDQTLRAAGELAPQTVNLTAERREEIVSALRRDIIAQANAQSAGSPVGLVRETMRCMYLDQGNRQFARFREEAFAALETSHAAGQMVLSADTALRQLLDETIPTLRARIAEALRQLPLSFLERDFAGAPVWIWLTGGAVLVVGGALGVRALRERRPKPTPNRRARRRRKRTSR